MNYCIRLNIDHTTELIEMPEDHDYRWYAKQIGCDWIEIVHPKYSKHPLIVDEEGRLKDNHINMIASGMYGTFEHGEPIVGTCLLVNEKWTDEGDDICGFDFVEANKIKAEIDNDVKGAFNRLLFKEIL